MPTRFLHTRFLRCTQGMLSECDLFTVWFSAQLQTTVGARSKLNMVFIRLSARTKGTKEQDESDRSKEQDEKTKDARHAAGYDKAERAKEPYEKQDYHKKSRTTTKQKMVKAKMQTATLARHSCMKTSSDEQKAREKRRQAQS